MAIYNETSPGALKLILRFPNGLWVAFAFVGFCMLIFSLGTIRNDARLASEGVETMAVVTDKRDTTNFDRKQFRRTGELTYRFETPDGTQISGTSPVQYTTYLRSEIGDQISIVYWPQNPTLNEAEPDSLRKPPWYLGAVGALFATVGSIVAGLHIRTTMTYIKLRDHGQKRTATVTGKSISNVNNGKKTLFRLEWQDEEGHTGQSLAAAARLLEPFATGSTINVYFDPKHPDRQVWQGDYGLRKGESAGINA